MPKGVDVSARPEVMQAPMSRAAEFLRSKGAVDGASRLRELQESLSGLVRSPEFHRASLPRSQLPDRRQ